MPIRKSEPSGEDYRPLIENQTYDGVHVQIDAARFQGCTFNNCVMVYSGGAPHLEQCVINDCQFSFTGPAANTISFMQSLGRIAETAELVREMIRDIAGETVDG